MRCSTSIKANKRELLADYALPVAVISFSFIGSFVFDKVSLQQFDATEVRLDLFFIFFLCWED